MPHKPILLLALSTGLALAGGTANAAKQWDPYTGITFSVTGLDDAMAPSNEGDNGLQQDTYQIISYGDVDHWIDPDESAPNNEGYPAENLPFYDITYSTDAAPAPTGVASCLMFNGDTSHNMDTSTNADYFIFTAPDQDGVFTMKFTGTDQSQVIGPGETGSRRDPDNTDNWWDIAPTEQ